MLRCGRLARLASGPISSARLHASRLRPAFGVAPIRHSGRSYLRPTSHCEPGRQMRDEPCPCEVVASNTCHREPGHRPGAAIPFPLGGPWPSTVLVVTPAEAGVQASPRQMPAASFCCRRRRTGARALYSTSEQALEDALSEAPSTYSDSPPAATCCERSRTGLGRGFFSLSGWPRLQPRPATRAVANRLRRCVRTNGVDKRCTTRKVSRFPFVNRICVRRKLEYVKRSTEWNS